MNGGEVGYGDYTIVDVSARWFIDAGRRQQLNFSIRNLFDQTYGRPGRGCKDVATDGPYDCSMPYTYVNLGMPRTFGLSYSYSF